MSKSINDNSNIVSECLKRLLCKMSPFKVILWPIINLLKLTGLMPLSVKNGFSASKSAQCVSLLMIFCFVTFGSVRSVLYIFFRTDATLAVDFIKILGIVLILLSAVSSINYLVFKAETIAKLLTNLEKIFIDLRNVNIGGIIFRVWLQFSILYVGPLLNITVHVLKIYNNCAGKRCHFDIFIIICNAAQSNCSEAAVIFFLSIGQLISELYKALWKDLEAAALNSNTRKRNARFLILKNYHQKLYESAKKLNCLFGILLLLGLIASNIFLQTYVFNFLRTVCKTKGDTITIFESFMSELLFLIVDLGRITLTFITCHSVSVQVVYFFIII